MRETFGRFRNGTSPFGYCDVGAGPLQKRQ
jgi:hypothetical protein